MPVTPNIRGVAIQSLATASSTLWEGPVNLHVVIYNTGGEPGNVKVELYGKGPLTGYDPAVFHPLAQAQDAWLPTSGDLPVPFGTELWIDRASAPVYLEARVGSAVHTQRVTVKS